MKIRATVSVLVVAADGLPNVTAPDADTWISPTAASAPTVTVAAFVTNRRSAAVNAPDGAGDQFAASPRFPSAPPIQV